MTTIGPALDGVPTLYSVGFDLATVGYSAHEHLVTGTATSFVDAEPRRPDGRWSVEPDETAEFETRVVVYCPTDPARGNGTAIVEWLNVTGGLDIPAVWMPTQRHLVRDGYTWVGVSVQRVSIEGGGMMPGLGLQQTTPERYGSLRHPGDAYSFDIFTQVGRAMRSELGDRYGLRIDRAIATGASQSAFHLTTYVNAIDPREKVFDGFLLQGRAGAGVPTQGFGPLSFGPSPEDRAARIARLRGRDQIRADARVPVLVVQSETDVFGSLAYLPARQEDSEHFRLWEVTGAAHCDTYFLNAAALDADGLGVEMLGELIARNDGPGFELPINSGPQIHYALERAVDALDHWIREGIEPPSAARIEVDDNGKLMVDEVGVARGGVRSPWVDVPIAVLSGLGQPGLMTELFGTTRAFDDATLRSCYSLGRDEYVGRFRDATRAAVDAGFILEVDAPEIEALGSLSWPTG